jgi:hypothetical protein
MTKEQLLKLVSEAYDDGAEFDINFHGLTKKEADELSGRYAEHFDTPRTTDSSGKSQWHEYKSKRVELITFY